MASFQDPKTGTKLAESWQEGPHGVGVQVSIGVDMNQEISNFVHTSSMGQQIWTPFYPPFREADVQMYFFLVSQRNEVKKITDAFHDLVDGKRILREVKGVKG